MPSSTDDTFLGSRLDRIPPVPVLLLPFATPGFSGESTGPNGNSMGALLIMRLITSSKISTIFGRCLGSWIKHLLAIPVIIVRR
jgi:hypothetical protein